MQNELFYSYIDDNDKEFMAIEAAADIEMQKSLLALEYADRLYDIKLRQAELKVLNESGTFEDLDALYEAAGKENSERKDGARKAGKGICGCHGYRCGRTSVPEKHDTSGRKQDRGRAA